MEAVVHRLHQQLVYQVLRSRLDNGRGELGDMRELHEDDPRVITLGAHAQRGYGSWVCVSVCLSVTLHLTSQMFVRLTNDTTCLTGNEGQKYRTVFSENAPLRENKRKSQYANEYSLTAALLQRPLARCFDDRGF